MSPEQTSNPEKIQHIWCSVEITKKMEDVLIGFILTQAQNNENISEYVVYLSTTGGNPFAAISLYNFIKSIPQKTTVYNMGTVASAGVPFFLAFQKRIGVPDCSFMVHQTALSQNSLADNVTVFEMETQKVSLEATDEKAQKIIVKETASKGTKSLTPTSIKEAFLKTTYYDAEKAHQLGFIEEIELPTLPNTGVLYITDQYLATLPG
jgi:ATP-dependent protease ClpP protease subunit